MAKYKCCFCLFTYGEPRTNRVKKFLNSYRSKHTRKNYRIALTDFFRAMYGDSNHLDSQAETYFNENRDYEADVEQFVSSITSRAPKTLRLKISAVRTFLVDNDVELSQKFWRKVRRRIKGNRALTLDKVPSNTELRKIVMHMPIHGKALYLMLASSGMRIGEALQLKLDDVNADNTPVRIQIRGEYTKTGNPRHAFASRETREALEEWLKVRRQYLEAASGKSHKHGKTVENDRLFPFQTTTAYMMWRGALKKAKMAERDKSTNRRRLHPHVLRKFFRTKLGAVIPVDVAEALMGHEGYLTEVSRRYSLEDLAKFYLQGESALLVFTEAEEVGKLRAEVEERNRQLQVLVNGLRAENLEMKSEVAKLKMENTNLRKDVAELQKGMANVTKMVEKLVNPNYDDKEQKKKKELSFHELIYGTD